MSTLHDVLRRQLSTQRLIGPLFALFALLLATGGVYAVTAYAVTHCMRELGVRIALGADARRVWWAVTGATLRQLAIGLVLGGAGAAGGLLRPARLPVRERGPASAAAGWYRRGRRSGSYGQCRARTPRAAGRPGDDAAGRVRALA